ncbi:zinc finger protein 42 homolog [Phyllostomus discolor]|uniref:Zinc finger protein 42 homolog n=1 Tax=Phyllostomus discolor TaxID=89673 RepID=A0A6J2MRI3_9CHIR|nr:zinc finger protein 42 homolog [Phyllostomus discolor]
MNASDNGSNVGVYFTSGLLSQSRCLLEIHPDHYYLEVVVASWCRPSGRKQQDDMEHQLNTQAKASGLSGPGEIDLTGDELEPVLQELPNVMQSCWDEDGDPETSSQAAEEEPTSDCYIECVIRSEFAELVKEEDMILTSFKYRKNGPEQAVPQQVPTTSSLAEDSLPCMTQGAKQEFSQQVVGEKSSVEYSEPAADKKHPRGEIPNTSNMWETNEDLQQLMGFVQNKPRENEGNHAPEKIVCPHRECAKLLKNRDSLRKHVLLVHGPRNHVCAECGKAFAEKSKLKRHFMVHTGERPFQCTFKGCGKRFSLAYNLRTHVRVHTGEKTYVCTFQGCLKRFSQSTNLKNHLLTHTKSKISGEGADGKLSLNGISILTNE